MIGETIMIPDQKFLDEKKKEMFWLSVKTATLARRRAWINK